MAVLQELTVALSEAESKNSLWLCSIHDISNQFSAAIDFLSSQLHNASCAADAASAPLAGGAAAVEHGSQS
jgi:hypothetical protein